jgi:hypothetical protein
VLNEACSQRSPLQRKWCLRRACLVRLMRASRECTRATGRKLGLWRIAQHYLKSMGAYTSLVSVIIYPDNSDSNGVVVVVVREEMRLTKSKAPGKKEAMPVWEPPCGRSSSSSESQHQHQPSRNFCIPVDSILDTRHSVLMPFLYDESNLQEESFSITEYLPSGSYSTAFLDALYDSDDPNFGS